jgi:hypothetical protein
LIGCSYWILKMPYSWKSWVNLANEFYGGFMVLMKNHFACVWIHFVEIISWSWEQWAINLLKTNYDSL